MSLLDLAHDLCTGITGSKCAAPRLSSWYLTDPAQISAGVDALDLLSLGITTIVPANLKAYGSYFTTGLVRKSASGGMSAYLSGYGAGAGIGAGWGPSVTGMVMGDTKTIKQQVLQKLGDTAQGLIPKGGWGGGTRIVAGPDSAGDLTLSDFRDSYAVVMSLGANFVVNGVSASLVIMSKGRPVLIPTDIAYAKAFGLMASVGFAVSIDVEVSNMIYMMRVSGA